MLLPVCEVFLNFKQPFAFSLESITMKTRVGFGTSIYLGPSALYSASVALRRLSQILPPQARS